MRARYLTVDVFTDRRFTGNQLAVFPDGRGIDAGRMQAIAREFNLSETVFVLPPDDPRHARRLRIFTPGRELPFAGHPTVGTAWVLAHVGLVPLRGDRTDIVLEEGVGPVRVAIAGEQGRPVSSQLAVAKLPEAGPPPPAAGDLAAMLSLDASDLDAAPWEPQGFSCGVPFLFVPVRTRDAVARVRARPDAFDRTLGDWWTSAVFVFSREVERSGSDLHARMFAPELGVSEDPATGSAVAALGGYLGARDATHDGVRRWVVEQGFEMGRPSILELEVEKQAGRITDVRVGGPTVFVSEGEMEVGSE